MGKSPGKWIKGILFGKKTSKSDISKGRVLSKSASERPARSSSKETMTALSPGEPVISGPVSDIIANESNDSGFEPVISGSVSDTTANESNNSGFERRETINGEKVPDQGLLENQLEQAVITLQAAARGNLVRRQAAATLRCMQGIVRFQALVRGHIVRKHDAGTTVQFRGKFSVAPQISETCEITEHVQASRLLKNGLIHKLCCSSTSVMPLRLAYDQDEPNSAWNWLIRWSTQQVWAPYSKPKEDCESKNEAAETESSENFRKYPNRDEHEKRNIKLNEKKPSAQSSEPAKENGLSGKSDKVKHDQKLVKPARQVSTEAETDVEIPRSLQRKTKPSKSATPKLSEQKTNVVMDKPVEDTQQAVPENDEVKSGVDHILEKGNIAHLSSEEKNPDLVPDKSGNDFPVNKESTDDRSSIVSHKSNRRASLPASKHDDDQCSIPESATKLPSYMAKTASSKAKVKAQVSPRLGLDRKNLDRRLSLPSSVNGKMISSSPRLVQGNLRDGIKIDRSLSSSRDVPAGKAIKVDWKR